jgi:hypothetical protein
VIVPDRVLLPLTFDAPALVAEAWYLDLNLPHRVANRSAVNRIHLVVDCVIDEWQTALMQTVVSPRPDGLD